MLTAIHRKRMRDMGNQKGMTLIELMIAMAVSLIVSGAMVAVMANTLGTGSRTIGMTRLDQEMRTAMQIMSRDLRRANYIGPLAARTCFSNVDCLADLGIADKIGTVQVGDSDDCMSFWLDRDVSGALEDDERGGFRLTVANGIGTIEMLTDSNGMDASNCPTGTWVAITSPDIVDIESLVVNNADTYNIAIGGGSTYTVQKLNLLLNARLINSGSAGNTISRAIGDEIRVRNDFTSL